MVLPDRGGAFRSAPLGELLGVLLRQLRRPLGAHGVGLSDAQAAERGEQIAAALEGGSPLNDPALVTALTAIVRESEAVLARWNLTFAESLVTSMEAITGWETTAEFLEVANEKANAELRISTSAALLTALGARDFAGYLRHVLAREDDDLDTLIAARVLSAVDAADSSGDSAASG